MGIDEIRVVMEVKNVACTMLTADADAALHLSSAIAQALVISLAQPYPLGTIKDIEDNVGRVTLLPCLSEQALLLHQEDAPAGDEDDWVLKFANLSEAVAAKVEALAEHGVLGAEGMELKETADYLAQKCGFLPPQSSSVFAFHISVSTHAAAYNVSTLMQGQ